MEDTLFVHDKPCRIIKLLGHGKGGYSYLAEYDGKQAVLKRIHHEPCEYYSFGNKIMSEINDYERLKKAGIRIPEMIAVDIEAELIVKEYIEGETVYELVKNGKDVEPYIIQVRQMASQAAAANMNIDFFPTNFVVKDGLLWYVDYECNDYNEEWNLENWGIKYWSRTPAFIKNLEKYGEAE